MKHLLLAVIAFAALSACGAPEPSAQLVPPAGFTPSSLAAQKIIVDGSVSDTQRAADEAARQQREVLAAIAQATVIAQSTQAAHDFSVQATQDALNAAIAAQAATATAEHIAMIAHDEAIVSTQQAGVVYADMTKTALAVQAQATQAAQTAHERAVAFDLSATQNQNDQQRAKESAEFMAWVFRIGALSIVAVIVYFLYHILKIKSDLGRMVQTDYGIYLIMHLPDGRLSMQPLLKSGNEIIDQVDETSAAPETMIADHAIEVVKGDDPYWQAEKECRSNAAELLRSAIEHLGEFGPASNKLPGYRDMGWSADTHSKYKRPIAKYFVSTSGKGSVLTDKHYPSLHSLYLGVVKRQAAIDVVDGQGNPIPLTRFA